MKILHQMMFLEIGVLNFWNMPQFNRKYPSGAEKNKEKVRKNKG